MAPRLAAVCKAFGQAVGEAWAEILWRFPRRLYVVGGLNLDFAEVDSVWRLDLTLSAWESLPPLPVRCAGPAAAIADGKLFVLGGEASGHALNAVHAYDPALGRWEAKPSMLDGRIRASAVYCGGFLYVMGGLDGSRPLRTAERFDPRTNKWEHITQMHRPRYACASSAQPHGLVLAFGGELTDAGLTASLEIYDPEASTWELLPAVRAPSCGAAIALTESGKKAFTFGGLGLSGQALPLAEQLHLGGALEMATDEKDRPQGSAFVPPSWSQAPPMPTPRHLASVTGFGAGAVAVGGKGPTFEAVRNVELFDPEAGVWESLPPLPEARLRAAVVSGRF